MATSQPPLKHTAEQYAEIANRLDDARLVREATDYFDALEPSQATWGIRDRLIEARTYVGGAWAAASALLRRARSEERGG